MVSDQQLQTPSRLFGTSGVRGVIHKDLTIDMLSDIGQAIATSLPPHSWVIVANDTRKTRNEVKAAVELGLIVSGVHIIDVGTLPTPALGFLTQYLGMSAGIMITASHNPPEYNGIKIFSSDGIGYTPEQESYIEEIYSRKNFRMEKGTFQNGLELQRTYFDNLKQKFSNTHFAKRFRIIVDPGNGAASNYASELFSDLGLDVIPLNDTPDGNFPNRSAEPRAETLLKTYECLRKNRADLAVCFDGDADRVVFIDEHGFIDFDQAVTFIASLAVKASGKKKVAATVETGKLIELGLQNQGVEVVRGIVGDAYVACLARSIDAAIGVESVGVYIMPEAGFYPNSFLAALTLLSNVESIADVRHFFEGIPKLYTQYQKIPCPNNEKLDLMDRVLNHSDLLGTGTPNTIDGLRMEYGDSWMLIRPSGTEPLIRISAESTSEIKTQALLNHGASVISALMRK